MKIKEKNQRRLNLRRSLKNIVYGIFMLVGFLAFFSAWWYVRVYGRIGFDSVLYTLTGGLGGVSTDLIGAYLTGGVLPAVVSTVAAQLLLFANWNWKRWIPAVLSLVLSLGLVIHAAFNVELVSYLLNSHRTSDLYEREYRDPDSVQITFPEEKRNLIYIYMESMETSYLSQELGGGLPYNLIPELTELAKTYINFSHNDGVDRIYEIGRASCRERV